MYCLIACLIRLFICLYVCLCVYVFVCLCVDVFMYLWNCGFMDLCKSTLLIINPIYHLSLCLCPRHLSFSRFLWATGNSE